MDYKKGKVLKSFHNYEEGEVYDFKPNNFKDLLKSGFISPVEEVKKKRSAKKK